MVSSLSRCLAVAVALGLSGQPAEAIVGGRDEAGPLLRRTVMVLSSGGGVCSAVVVASDAVLTAAHCASGAPEHRVHWKGADGAPVLVQPRAVLLHPGYDAGAIAGRRRSIDLALIRLPEPLPQERFEPALLDASAPRAGAGVALSGYGLSREGEPRTTGTLRSADLQVVEPYGPSRILAWMRASGGARSGACRGDSGGPVTGADGTVFAVATWATGPAREGCGGLSQAVLIGPQRAWIDGALARWGTSAAWR